jgi:xanthomonalisin
VTSSDGNAPPFASFTSPHSGLTVSFTDFTKDPNGSVVAWAWEFGDGGTSSARHPSHTYAAGGRYFVTLTATDNAGRTHSRTRFVVVP